MEALEIKAKNRRIIVGVARNYLDNADAFCLIFKRLAISQDEVAQFESNPTCHMSIERRIVKTSLNLSLDGAIALKDLLEISIETYLNNKNGNNN